MLDTHTMGRIVPILLVGCLTTPAVYCQGEDPAMEDLAAGRRHLKRGELGKARIAFDDVILDYEEAEAGDEKPSEAAVRGCRQGLFEIDLIHGDYDEVLGGIAALPAAEQARPGYRLLRARASLKRGQYDEAEQLLRGLAEANPKNFEARFRYGELLAETGRRAEARDEWKQLVDLSRAESVRDASALSWIANAQIALGGRGNWEQAATLLVEAIRLDGDLALPRILYGRLRFLAYGEWDGAKSGEGSLKEVLRRNGEVEAALIELYRTRRRNHMLDPSTTESYLSRALSVNPHSVPALLERAILLLDDRRFQEGIDKLDEALAVNPNDKHVLAQRAAAAKLVGDTDGYQEYRRRAAAVDPKFAGLDIALGDRLVALYRFGDAVEHYRQALETDETALDALHGLAKALIYSGEGEEARKHLELAKTLQPGVAHPWRHNALAVEDLLREDYVTVEGDGYVFYMHRDDHEVLKEYLPPLLQEAMETLGAKYGYRPEQPLRLEVFHTWDDFSVRTIGFRGFTALGACFGPLITLVSPGDGDLRRQGFMWSATVWHEFAHVLTLGLTAHRVPRWLTEGVSVYEEGVKSKTWERGMTRDLLDAYHNDQLPPVRLLNRLFRGPRILFGYYQGGLIVDLLAQEYGFDKVVDMLRYYAEDLSTEECFRRAFGTSTREFDRKFLKWVREEKLKGLRIVPRFDDRSVQRLLTKVAGDPKDVESRIKLAWAFLDRDVRVDAATQWREARRLDPDNPELHLIYAELLRRREAYAEAVEAYELGFENGADDFMSRIRFGSILAGREDFEGAARQYQAAKRCWPNCTDENLAPSLLLAKLYRETGDKTQAMMELKIFCKRTARAFQPRLELAEYERAEGNRRDQARLLEECVQIDPFMRKVHLDLADAYIETGRKSEAVRELRVSLAIRPSVDRAFIGKPPEEVPADDDPKFHASQAEVCVKLAKLLRELGRSNEAGNYLDRAIAEAPDSDAADEARRLKDR